jgi:hypothetical protein
VTAALTIPPAEREDRSILPEDAIPVNPEAAPSAEISQLEELTATVAVLFPRVVTPVEDSVVKAPVPGVVLPIGPGAAKVAPFRELALRLATLVVEATTNGAVPVARVEVICPLAEMVVKAPVP